MMNMRRSRTGYTSKSPGSVWPPLIALELFFCWNAPTCDCQGFPLSSVTYQVQRQTFGNPSYQDHSLWGVVADGITQVCFEDITDPPVGMAYWYRTFAKAPNGTYCCEEGGA